MVLRDVDGQPADSHLNHVSLTGRHDMSEQWENEPRDYALEMVESGIPDAIAAE